MLRLNSQDKAVLLRRSNSDANSITIIDHDRFLQSNQGWHLISYKDKTLKSKNGVKSHVVPTLPEYKLTLQDDGNLQFCKGTCTPTSYIWQTGYHGTTIEEYGWKIQGDGHHISRRKDDSVTWRSGKHRSGVPNWFIAYNPTLNKIAVFPGLIESFDVNSYIWIDDTNPVDGPVPGPAPGPAEDKWHLIANEEETLKSKGRKHLSLNTLPNHQLVLMSNSNLVLCEGTGGTCAAGRDYLWQTDTSSADTSQDYSCMVQGDCHFLCREESGTPYWRSKKIRDDPSNCFLAYNPGEQKLGVFEGTIDNFDENDSIWTDTAKGSGPVLPQPPPPVPPPTPPVPSGSTVLLKKFQTLRSGDYKAVEGAYLICQDNGYITLYQGTYPSTDIILWQQLIDPYSMAYYVLLQGDGHFLGRSGTPAASGGLVFKTKAGTDGNGYNLVTFKDEGTNLVGGMAVYEEGTGRVIWSTNGDTPSPPGPPPGPPPSSPGPQELMLLAYYYPWYYRNDWSRHGYQDEPLLGKYGTDEPAVAEQHNAWAERAGIDTWVVSYTSPTSLTSRHFAQGMLKANNIGKMKFCMLFESLSAFPTLNFADGNKALNFFIDAMKHIRDTYFGHSQYLRINGRPVVLLYVTRRWENFEPHMLDAIKDGVGVDIFFIADEPFYGRQNNVNEAFNGIQDGKPIFEAYTTYNMYTDPTVRPGESAKDFMFREALPVFQHWSKNTVFFPHVLPMYHDFRGHPPLIGDAAGLRDQLDTFACLPRPSWYKGEYPNMMFVTSWNEWWEGSQIEPDAAGKYGFTFIDELRRFKDAGIQCG